MTIDRRFRRYSNTCIDLVRLKAEAYTLMYDYPNGVYHTQRSLQTDGSDDWAVGTGSMPGIDESIWDKLHPSLAGTWWEQFFADLPFKVYRARLLTIQPRTCYSIHTDRTPRIHIAIDTHPQARFIFTNPPAVRHIPADGHIWWVDTREEHSAMNGSMKPRIHFVACLDNTDPD
jgi:hypothetical protein